MRKRKRILCALLAAAMLMDVGSLPVGAAALGSDVRVASEVQNTEGPALQTEITPSETITGEPIYSTEGSYAYYDADKHQVVWYNEAFEDDQTYNVSIGGNNPVNLTAEKGSLIISPVSVGTMISLKAVKTGETTGYTVQLDTGIMGTKGVVKEYPNGKVQAENLQETSEAGVNGKLLLVYADARENVLSLMKDSQGTAVVDISAAKTIDHVVAVDYKNVHGTYVYGNKRKLSYEKVSLGVPTLKSVKNEECKFTITWNPVPYATKYYIYRTDAKGNPTADKLVRTTTSFTNYRLPGNVKYYYVVVAVADGRDGEVIGSSSEVMTASPTMKVLEKIKSLKATAGDGQIKLSWAKVENATKYVIQQSVDGSNGWKDVASTSGTSYTLSNVVNGKKYSFRMYAVRTANEYSTYSANSFVSATPKLIKPVKPTSLSVTEVSNGNKLTWKSSGKVTGFIIYSYDYNKSKYVKLATVKNATSYIHKGTKSTERYKYAVKAYRMDNGNYYESPIAEKLVFGKKLISSTNSTVHPLYYTAYMKKKIGMFKTQWETSSSKYIRVIKKGTKVTVIRLHPSKPKIRLSDGTEGYTYRGALRLSSELYTSKQYTKQQVECFVNQRTYTSNTKYLIWIATYPQRIYVFKGSKGNWTLVRSGRCATGAITTPDYPGEKKVSGKKRWHYYGKRFYQYLSILNDGNTIHTRPAYRKSGKYVDSRLGRPLSRGCIRVTDADGGYIYKNCGKGTKVVVY